jgi:ZIP family zinc transporter
MIVLFIFERSLPHLHLMLRGNEMPAAKRKAVFLAGTITLHNIPEGFAIACAFADSTTLGWLVTVSIAFQDIPEGLLVSTPLVCYGLEKRRCVKFGVFSGFVEFAAAIVGYIFLNTIVKLIPFALAFSAGAMLYVVVEELLPDALKDRPRRTAAFSFISGILAAWVIATLFGF